MSIVLHSMHDSKACVWGIACYVVGVGIERKRFCGLMPRCPTGRIGKIKHCGNYATINNSTHSHSTRCSMTVPRGCPHPLLLSCAAAVLCAFCCPCSQLINFDTCVTLTPVSHSMSTTSLLLAAAPILPASPAVTSLMACIAAAPCTFCLQPPG